MSRGGRGGFGGGAEKNKYPFEIDPDLEKEIYSYGAQGDGQGKKEADPNALFPPYPGGIPYAPPPTKREKERVAIKRRLDAAAHAHPLYTGPRGTLARLQNKKRSAAEFNAFTDQPTYSKRFKKKEFTLPTDADIKNYKWQAPHLFPKELWNTIGYNPDKKEDPNAPKKKLAINNNIVDKLARFDDDADDVPDVENDDEEVNPDDDEAEEAEPQDDDFEEDEDDGDDYNAEQYFDGGDEDYDEGGGEEYGDDGDEYVADYADREPIGGSLTSTDRAKIEYHLKFPENKEKWGWHI